MNYAYNIPETILGKDGRTVYSIRWLSSGCVFEIVPVNQARQGQQRPAHPGNRNWHKGPQQNAAPKPTQVPKEKVVDSAKSPAPQPTQIPKEKDVDSAKSAAPQQAGSVAPKKKYYRRGGPKKGAAQVADQKGAEPKVAKSD